MMISIVAAVPAARRGAAPHRPATESSIIGHENRKRTYAIFEDAERSLFG